MFTGKISDKEITRRSGILELLENGDEVMTDKGFLIQDFLDPIGAKLVIPPFLGNTGIFSKEDVTKTNCKATYSCREGHSYRCKEFHIFDQVIPLSIAGTVNQIWTVCCIVNKFPRKTVLIKAFNKFSYCLVV